jgi:hypothetical protein
MRNIEMACKELDGPFVNNHVRLRSNCRAIAVLAITWFIASPYLPGQAAKNEPVVIMAISQATILGSMINTPQNLPTGQVVIGIAALLSPIGTLRDPLCSSDNQTNCKLIEKTFLSRPRTY